MDEEVEKVKSLGFFGTYKESFKLIAAWKKVFFQITVTLILPVSLVYLTCHQTSNYLSLRIIGDTIDLEYNSPAGTPYHDIASQCLSSSWLWFSLIKTLYFTLLLLFSLFSTAAVTYTVASVYSRRHITFRNLMSVVPKVWKRLAITFVCTYVTFFLYNVAFVVLLVVWFIVLSRTSLSLPFFIIICIVFLFGFVYLNVVWQLTSVVSVLENYSGFKAMKKSKGLIKGKFWLGFFVLLFPGLAMLALEIGFMFVLISVDVLGVVGQIFVGMLIVVLMLFVILYALVIQTVFYFVCKSYHNEDVDRPALANHLGDYEELIGPTKIQMRENSRV